MDLTGPGAPLDNLLAWTILAWTRRTFFNEPNNAATPAAVNATATAVTPIVQEPVDISSPNASGAVTVKIVATDPLGRPLTYWVLTPPAPATGAVTTNATPGEFTYTPTTDARVSAATGGPTTDTFTIAVAPTANPNVFTTVTITAPVKPATGTLTLTAEANDPNCLGTSCGPDLIRTVVYEGTLSTTTDPSGIPVAYSVTDGPKYGEVHIDPTTGTWTYTPTIEAVNATWLGPGLTGFLPDSFKTADDLPASGSFGSAAIVGDPENNLPGGDPELAEHVWVWDGARWVDRGLFWTFDPFTITAHDPNASALYPYSSVEITPALPKRVFDPYGVKYTGCSVNGNCSAITPAPGGGGTGIAYVSAAGNKWIYSVSKPPEHGKVEINQTTSTFEDGNRRCPGCKGYTYTGISTGTFTYTPNATLAESGGVTPEVGNDDIFTIRATDPNDPTIFREIDVSVDVLANNAGSVWSELFNQIEPKTNQAAIGSSIGPDPVTSKSGYVIGTGSTTPGTGIERPPPPQGDVPIVICGGPHILDPTAPPELCINPSDAHAEDRPTVTQTQTAPTSGTPSTPTSTVAAGMPVVGAATPASSIEGVPQGDVPGWRENITKDPITTDKYTVQEGDTLSGIAQRWGLGDDRTKNYQDLATPPPLKPLSSDTRTVPSTIRSKDKATTSDGGCPPRPRSPGYSPADHGDVSTLADGL